MVRRMLIAAAVISAALAVPGVASASEGATPMLPHDETRCFISAFGYTENTEDTHGVIFTNSGAADHGGSLFVCTVRDTGLSPDRAIRLPASPTSCPVLLTPSGRLTGWCVP